MSPEYASQLHPKISVWLQSLAKGEVHGSELVEFLGRPCNGKPGWPDNCRWSDQILEIFTEAGWVIRAEKPKPTRTQLYFGWGGHPPGRRPSVATAGASEYVYTQGPNLPLKVGTESEEK